MNPTPVNRVEWFRAQELLIQLAQTLSSFSENENGTPSGESFSWTQRFFNPQSNPSQPLRAGHTVLLLKTLQKSQKELEEWSEKVPAAHVPVKKEEGRGEGREVLSPSAQKSSPKPEQSVPAQAQKLLKEVRSAIQSLSNPEVFSDPKGTALGNALDRLKPLIKDLVQTATRKEASAQESQEPKADLSPPKNAVKRKELTSKEEPIAAIAKKEISSKIPPEKKLAHLPPALEISTRGKKEVSAPIEISPKVERTSLPVVPFVAQSLPLQRKLKKKKKGLWFYGKEEEEDKNETSP